MSGTHDIPTRPSSTAVAPAGATAASAPAPAEAEDHAEQSGGFFVGLIVGGVVFATVLMVAFIWFRWNGVREPTTAVIVQGDASLDGAVITVTRAEAGRKQHRSAINASNRYTASVLVEPGKYWVTAERNGLLLLRRQVEVKRFLAVQFDLSAISRQADAPLPWSPAPPISSTSSSYSQ